MGFFVAYRQKLGNMHFGIRMNGWMMFVGLFLALFYYMFVAMAWMVYFMALAFYYIFKYGCIGFYYFCKWIYKLYYFMFKYIVKFFKWIIQKINNVKNNKE